MLCFRDMTFCGSDCTNVACPRHFGPDDDEATKRWWGGSGAPVAFGDYAPRCADYTPPTSADASLAVVGEGGKGSASAIGAVAVTSDRPTSDAQKKSEGGC